MCQFIRLLEYNFPEKICIINNTLTCCYKNKTKPLNHVVRPKMSHFVYAIDQHWQCLSKWDDANESKISKATLLPQILRFITLSVRRYAVYHKDIHTYLPISCSNTIPVQKFPRLLSFFNNQITRELLINLYISEELTNIEMHCERGISHVIYRLTYCNTHK